MTNFQLFISRYFHHIFFTSFFTFAFILMGFSPDFFFSTAHSQSLEDVVFFSTHMFDDQYLETGSLYTEHTSMLDDGFHESGSLYAD